MLFKQNSMDIQVSFIILSWNSDKFLADCFDSITSKCQEEKISNEIIIIDNGSTDESPSIIKSYQEKIPHVFKMIMLDRNMGTTYPRNLGLRQAKGDFICVLDSDTEIVEGAFHDIFSILYKRSDIGIIAPQLLHPADGVQNSVKKFPTFFQKISKLPRAMFHLPLPNLDFYNDFPFESETMVDTAISACWIFRKDVLQSVGLFDEKIFYSPEDLDFCMRVWNNGLKIIYYPNFRVLHKTQQISHRKPFSKISISHFFGLIYYFKKHGGWFSNKKIYKKIQKV